MATASELIVRAKTADKAECSDLFKQLIAMGPAAHGVTHVFGIASVHNLPIYEALTRTSGITVVRMRHEQGATHAADGYARATGRLGVVLASTGPVPAASSAAQTSSSETGWVSTAESHESSHSVTQGMTASPASASRPAIHRTVAS